MKKNREKKGQFSVIAALLVAVILVAAVIVTYATIRNLPFREYPETLSSIQEMNLAVNRILDFAMGYYGSILQVTGNATYAKELTSSYLDSGFVYIAHSHPDWNPSFKFNYPTSFSIRWFEPKSYSMANISVTYSLSDLGIFDVKYETAAILNVTILGTTEDGQARVAVMRGKNQPDLTLGVDNFFFYSYNYSESDWSAVPPDSVVIHSDGYNLTIPPGVDETAFSLQVVDPKGVMVTAFFSTSGRPEYTYTFNWNETFYSNSTLTSDTMVIEALQNGTLRWLGQNLQNVTRTRPIPPLPVRCLRVNVTTVDRESHEVPFQVEDWASGYRTPLGLSTNATLFSSRNMLVFLISHNVQNVQNVHPNIRTSEHPNIRTNVTLWWDGSDTAKQTGYAWKNRYFNDDPSNGILANENLTLILDETYLYVDSFDRTYLSWAEKGDSPYLNNNGSNYIYESSDDHREGWFGFQELTDVQARASVALKSVKIQFECRCSGDDYFDFGVDDGTVAHDPYNVTDLPDGYGWKTYDISSIIDDWTKINNIKIDVRYRRSGWSASTVYIRRCRLIVDFGGWVTSVVGNSYAKADFLRINGESPVYGADPAYVIHHGVVRDIVQQEAEWSGGISENLYVNGFDGTYNEWDMKTGSSPYLDDSSSYICDNDTLDTEGWFSFQNLSTTLPPASVRIQFECRCQEDEYFDFQIDNGTHIFGYYDIDPPSSYGWREYDLSDILDTVEEVNNARLRVRYRFKLGSAYDVYIRRCRLYVVTCPNVYSQIVLTLPANATYYTYAARTIFVNSLQSRAITDLSAIQLSVSVGQQQTENDTAGGYPVPSNATGLFYNFSSPTGWAHHWSEFISGNSGAGIMFTDSANQKLYVFDSVAGNKTGALNVISSGHVIEFNPVKRYQVSFTYPLDIIWHGAVVTFTDQYDPIYRVSNETGLWVMVEYPPTVKVS
ncbi:MAG: hypothetical protein U9O89_07120 [Thermoproteota archaeon]|nr:hypothetical protein [Thermoproteota archaeon]